jgi:hypothetical protein
MARLDRRRAHRDFARQDEGLQAGSMAASTFSLSPRTGRTGMSVGGTRGTITGDVPYERVDHMLRHLTLVRDMMGVGLCFFGAGAIVYVDYKSVQGWALALLRAALVALLYVGVKRFKLGV